MPVHRLWFPAVLSAFTLVACVDAPDDPIDDEPAAGPGHAVAAAPPTTFGALERGKSWSKDTLSVCFDDNTSEFGKNGLIREIVDREWGRAGRIRFRWNQSCTISPNSDIRIAHDPNIQGESMFGTDAQTISPGRPTMWINFKGPSGTGCVKNPKDPPSPGGPAALCDGVWGGGPPRDLDVWLQMTALHEFGHALGLRHEHVHPNSGCVPLGPPELLDDVGLDGEPIWNYDPVSIMSYCQLSNLYTATNNSVIRISAGDIRSLHTLYPGGVAIEEHVDYGGIAQWTGPGYYKRSVMPRLAHMSSIIVPPGYTVVACTLSSCAQFTESQRVLPAGFNDAVDNILVTVAPTIHDLVGFRGASQALSPGIYRAPMGQLAGVGGDNRVSSVWVPPTSAVQLCSDENLNGACVLQQGGQFVPNSFNLAFGIDNQVSSVEVSRRAVTYSDVELRGTTQILATGTYAAPTEPWLTDVKYVSVSGLRITACTSEGTYNSALGTYSGGGTCFTSDNSMSLAGLPAIRYLNIANLPVGSY